MLGPVFIIYIKDIDKGLTSKTFKFADDTKITSRVITTAEKIQLQSDLNC